MRYLAIKVVLILAVFLLGGVLPAWSADPSVLSGKWKLNKKESDNPKEKFGREGGGEGHHQHGGGGGGPWGGGGGHRGGGGGFGGGGDRGYRNGNGGHGGDSAFAPPETMVISYSEPEVKIADEKGKELQHFFTDGRKTEKEVDKERLISYTARWEEDQLVVQSQTPRGDPLTETYYLSPDSKKLYVKLVTERPMGDDTLTLIRVYDVVPPEAKKQ